MSVEADFRDALLMPEADIPLGLSDGQGHAAGRRYNVYRNNITVSLTEALETGFPAIAKLLGVENFKGLAQLYLRQHPPTSARMMFYGASFAPFLETLPALSKYPYLGDVARLEFALRESYHAADHQPLSPEALAVDPESLMAMPLRLAPSVRVLRSAWPVVSLWAYNMADGPRPQAQAEDVIVLRAEYDPVPHLLQPGGAAFIAALHSGATLGDAYEAATRDQEAFDIGALLTLLITSNAFEGTQP